MKPSFDWPQVLFQCKENVASHVQPLLKNIKELQTDLGRGAGGDRMKLVDFAAEKAIVEILLQRGVSFTLVSEESGIVVYGSKPEDTYVTVDPIDGTTNLVRGLPFYCSSIAVSNGPRLSEVYAALVSDLFHGTTYIAQRGKGASRNGERISRSITLSLEEAVVGLDLNTYKISEVASRVTALIEQAKHIRHFGANALELCFVAEGLTDAFVDIRGKLRTTDVAAGFLILREAGGLISSPDGKQVDADLDPRETVKFVASGNSEIHKAILNLIEPK